MKQIQYSVNVSKTSKSQALEVIRKLRDVMPIARASMLLRVVYPSEGKTITITKYFFSSFTLCTFLLFSRRRGSHEGS